MQNSSKQTGTIAAGLYNNFFSSKYHDSSTILPSYLKKLKTLLQLGNDANIRSL
uniref:Uncharacterized protein n=1 Tax=Arundo donax TaxID=35708 RepID=A0A0A9U4C5_ARUDO